MNVISGRLVRPSRRIPQIHKKVVSCYRWWEGRDVEIDGLLATCDCYPRSPTCLRLQQADVNSLHLLRCVEAFLKAFVSELSERADAVVLCNDDPFIS